MMASYRLLMSETLPRVCIGELIRFGLTMILPFGFCTLLFLRSARSLCRSWNYSRLFLRCSACSLPLFVL